MCNIVGYTFQYELNGCIICFAITARCKPTTSLNILQCEKMTMDVLFALMKLLINCWDFFCENLDS